MVLHKQITHKTSLPPFLRDWQSENIYTFHTKKKLNILTYNERGQDKNQPHLVPLGERYGTWQ